MNSHRRVTCSWVMNERVVSCRERGHPASAGQCRPGCDGQIPAAGGDGEASGEEGADRGASTLLYLRLHAPARCGEQRPCFCRECWTESRKKKCCSSLFLSLLSCCATLCLRMRRWPCWVRSSIFRPSPRTSKLWRWTPTNCHPPANRSVNKLQANCSFA